MRCVEKSKFDSLGTMEESLIWTDYEESAENMSLSWHYTFLTTHKNGCAVSANQSFDDKDDVSAVNSSAVNINFI